MTYMDELDIVQLTHDIPSEDLKRGERGTIVYVHGEGAFEVEFYRGGDEVVLTLRAESIRPTTPHPHV